MQKEVHPLIICDVDGYLWPGPFAFDFSAYNVVRLARGNPLREFSLMVRYDLPVRFLSPRLVNRNLQPVHGMIVLVQHSTEKQSEGLLLLSGWMIVIRKERG